MQRHSLVTLSPQAWSDILAREWDPVARECIACWAAKGWPLVVTTQRFAATGVQQSICLGLAAPLQWGRRRLVLQVPCDSIVARTEFPQARQVAPALPLEKQPVWMELSEAVTALGASMRVFGSHGWQHITDLAYVREGSDLDLCVAVENPAQADDVVALLSGVGLASPRLDGELMFANGDAVNWREWAAWRKGAIRQLLVKRLDGASLVEALPGVAVAQGRCSQGWCLA